MALDIPALVTITLTLTAPTFNADTTRYEVMGKMVRVCGLADSSSPCTDLARVRIYIQRGEASPSSLLADVDAQGHQGEELTITTQLQSGGCYSAYAVARDVTGNESCRWGGTTFVIPYQEVQVDTSALASWDFNEESGPALDGSGHGNDASLLNGATRVSGVLRLSGATQYARAGSSGSLGGSLYALAIQARVRRALPSSVGHIIHKGVPGSGGFVLGIGVPPCGANQVKATRYGVRDLCVNGFPADTLWHDVEWNSDEMGQRVYIDGVLWGGDPLDTRPVKPSTEPLGIGGTETVGVKPPIFWSGGIDDVVIRGH